MLAGELVYTIGQGSRTVSDIIDALRSRTIQYLCDVRTNPISNRTPDFCRDEFRAHLSKDGIVYASFGNSLGGRPADPTLYDQRGRVDYRLLMESPSFKEGIDRLVRGSNGGHRLALFCSEGRPEQCHRSKAVGVALQHIGLRVIHIDADGSDVDQDSVIARLAPPPGPPKLLEIEEVDRRYVSRKSYR